jgi:ABC-type transport system substrate-binding protein
MNRRTHRAVEQLDGNLEEDFMSRKHQVWTFALLVILSMLVVGCAQEAVQTVTAGGEIIVVTATPDPDEEPCDNPFLGSCKLDGNGIPPDFFSDLHVRKAFNYCFDWDTYIRDAWSGEAVQNVGYLIPGMVGYEPDGAMYSYNLEKCASELALAWDGAVVENGFRMQIAYNTGNVTLRTAAEILQTNLSEVDERYIVEVIGLPWSAFLEQFNSSRTVANFMVWYEDLHDPHNWAQPLLVGSYATRQNLPDDLLAQMKELVVAGVSAQTDEARAEAYHELNQIDYDQAIAIRLVVPTGRAWMQKWVEGYYYNPIHSLEARWKTVSKSADAPDPTVLTYATIGDVDTLDPAWNYETFGDNVILNIYEQLVTYDGAKASSFVPLLAEEYTISEDGTIYTFKIREGVTFHEGQDLTVEDVEYSFERGILQGGTWSPQWLFTEPFFGNGVYDVAELVDPTGMLDDDPQALQAADADALLAACEQVKDAIGSDSDAGTVTMTLAQPWGPFLATLAQSWGSIIDKDWAIEKGTWDGDCATWQNYYGIDSATSPIRDVVNGTGPYMLDHWEPGVEVVIKRNADYWAEPPAVERVIWAEVDEWGTRFAMAQVGDADLIYVPPDFIDQLTPLAAISCAWNADAQIHECVDVEGAQDQPLIVYFGHPSTSRADLFFVWNVVH